MKITKKEFYRTGGFSNPKQYRRQTSKGQWLYYRKSKEEKR